MILSPHIHKYDVLYKHKEIDCTKYIFPITGLELNEKLVIGNTIFFKKGMQLDETIPQISQKLFEKIETIAFVDLKNTPNIWKDKCDLSSIALQTLKQSIGTIYLAYYKANGPFIEKKISISNLNVHEVDEGLVPFMTENGLVNFKEPSKYLNMKLDDNLVTIIESACLNFNKALKMTTEMECKLLKVIESLYYVNNEIYSLERILKICAILNLVFIEDNDDQKEFNKVVKNIHQLFNYYGVNVYKKINLDDGTKLKDKLNQIHTEIRNKFSHGKFDLYNEFTVILESEYFIFKIVLYELLELLLNNKDFVDIKSSKDLNDFVNSMNKRFKSKN